MPFDIIVGRDESDKKLFGNNGLVYLGKTYVEMGNYTSLSNPIMLDVARTHVILVAGKRGGGKCLSGDSIIALSDGSLVPIEELEKNQEKIISLNENLKIQDTNKSEFFSREVNKLFKLKLRSGKEIKLTPEHPLLTIGGWKEAKDIKVGGRIATPRKLPFGNEKMSDEEIKLLAYLIAEGHTKKVVLFSNYDEKIVNEFKDSLYKFDSSLSLLKQKKGCYRISSKLWKNKVLSNEIIRDNLGRIVDNKNIIKKRSIRELIEREELFGKLSPKKYLSQNILRLNKPCMALFLNRLFSCDGSVYIKNYKNTKNTWQISYCSSSQKMIRQIQNVLLRFEIISKLREKEILSDGKKFESFELILNGENVIKFIEEIGFFGEKEEKASIALKELSLKNRNPNVDTIPQEIWNLYRPVNWTEIGRQMGYEPPKAMRERIRYSPSRQTLLQIAEIENSNPLKLLALSDIFWDEIVGIELLEGNFKVYDICVPENHNFVANDIIVHNSYTLGVMAEALGKLPREAAQNISSLIFDTMGIFWTMKFKNEKDKELLKEWKLETEDIKVRVFCPFGYFQEYKDRGIPVDAEFSVRLSELEPEDWISVFNLKFTDSVSVCIQNAITRLKQRENFSFLDIRKEIEMQNETNQEIKNSAISLFEAAENWKVFSANGVDIKDLLFPGETSIIDLSMYSSIGIFNVRALIIGLVSRKLFEERMNARKHEEIQAVQHGLDYLYYKPKREIPLVWIFIDEAHEMLPKDEITPASASLIQLLREGRQPGISLVLATQQPGKIHTDAMAQ